MKTPRNLICSLAGGLLSIPVFTMMQYAAAAGTDGAAPVVAATNQDDITQYQIVVRRNIFDQHRGSVPTNLEAAARPQTPVRQARIETFSFRGAAETVGKGYDAFFAGDGAPKTGTVVVNDEINGFKVQEIGLYEVKLVNTNDEVVTLKDQTGLTRRDGGPWLKVSVPATYSTSTMGRKAAVTYNAQFPGGAAAVTDENAGAYGALPGRSGGGEGTGSTVSSEMAGVPELASPANPDVLARLEARREQEKLQ